MTARRAPVTATAAPQLATIFVVAAVAWVLTVARAGHMNTASGTMGVGVGAFLVTWVLMMAAMMLPTVAPLASLYVRTFRDAAWQRTVALTTGYLLIWAGAGLPVLALARLGDRAVEAGTTPARGLACAIFAVAGAWQLSRPKDVCLRHCRSPLGLLLEYGSYSGRTRDLRVGLHHGTYCLGCCWALMAVLVAVGIMNVGAMVGLTTLVIAEKRLVRGEALARFAGVALLSLAVAAALGAHVAPGLIQHM